MLKKLIYSILFSTFIAGTALANSHGPNSFIIGSMEMLSEKDIVKKVVEDSYANGAFNRLDTDAMEKGFHRDFAIFSPKGEDIRKYPIKAWLAGTKKAKANANFNPNKHHYDYNFVSIDVTGKAAAVKIEYSKDDQMVYTDYLLLSKFDSGWKIVAKVYHGHQ
ncbi:MAG: nuclear transport factor 2 family protein [Candidatus Marinimicrobia bacterium]|nr:nuclear transport factor 2 family protein [Candidatus Neomarinimicrobiota bacterium]